MKHFILEQTQLTLIYLAIQIEDRRAGLLQEVMSPLKCASLMVGFKDNPQQNNCRLLCAAFDADSGGNVADIPALVALLASKGISMIVIEDKCVYEPGKKANSESRRIYMSLPTSYGRSSPSPHIRRW